MTGHVLEAGWLCPGCGHRIAAGETVHQFTSGAWRCTACRDRLSSRHDPSRVLAAWHTRYATGATLEELLRE